MKKSEVKVQVTFASTLEKVEAITNELKKGCFVRVATFKGVDSMNKKMLKRGNYLLGHVTERANYSGYQAGTNYTSSCQRAAERSGSNETFVAKAPNGHKRHNDFFEMNNDGTKFYLQLQATEQTQTHVTKTYYIDGVEATTKEVEEIKSFLPKKQPTQPSSQVEAGISAENQRKYIMINVADITSVNNLRFITEQEVKAYEEAQSVSAR